MNRSAFITGSATRLGRHIALHLAEKGWDIALHYHSSKEQAEELCQKILNTGKKIHCNAFHQDFTQANDFSTLIQKVYQEFPNLRLLVNNASIYEAASITQSSLQAWEKHFKVNAQAPFFLMQAFAKQFFAQNQGNSTGAIINILDNKIGFYQYYYAPYVLSKKVLAELSQMAALEWAPRLRVNAISPGIILPTQSRSPEYLAWRYERSTP